MPHGYIDTPAAKKAAKALAAGFIDTLEELGGHAHRINPDVFFSTGPRRIGVFWLKQHNGKLGRVHINGQVNRPISRLLQKALDLRSKDGTYGAKDRSTWSWQYRFPGEFECYSPRGNKAIEFTALLSELEVVGPWLARWIWAIEHSTTIPEPPFPIATSWRNPSNNKDWPLDKSGYFWSKAGWEHQEELNAGGYHPA